MELIPVGTEAMDNKQSDGPQDKGGGFLDGIPDTSNDGETKVDEDGYSIRPQVIKPSISESSSDSDSGM